MDVLSYCSTFISESNTGYKANVYLASIISKSKYAVHIYFGLENPRNTRFGCCIYGIQLALPYIITTIGVIPEMGKACRSIFLLRISVGTALRAEIQREFLKVERWHKFGDEIFIGHGGKLQEDSLEEQYRTLLMLNVVLNCIAFWNTLAIQQVVEQLRAEGHEISQEELSHVTPTMTEHIDLIGKFEINLGRNAPFKFGTKEEKKLPF